MQPAGSPDIVPGCFERCIPVSLSSDLSRFSANFVDLVAEQRDSSALSLHAGKAQLCAGAWSAASWHACL